VRLRFLLAALLAALAIPAASSASAAAPTPADIAAAQARAQVIETVRAQLGSQLATALQTQDQITQSLRDNASQQEVLNASIADTEAKLADLDAQIISWTPRSSTPMLASRARKPRSAPWPGPSTRSPARCCC